MVQSGQNSRQSSQTAAKVAGYFVHADEASALPFLARKAGSCLSFIHPLLMLGKDRVFGAAPPASQGGSLLLP